MNTFFGEVKLTNTRCPDCACDRLKFGALIYIEKTLTIVYECENCGLLFCKNNDIDILGYLVCKKINGKYNFVPKSPFSQNKKPFC
jgi:hypothetical protein